ncbi:MAG: hypothetical protein JXA41_15495 [Deltaproteobacteria bacterium]|nr:hypothetical protein [Deltaproteobacteria bacterium]
MSSNSIKIEDLEGIEWDDEESWEDELILEEEEMGLTGGSLEDISGMVDDLDEWEEYVDSQFYKLIFED